MAKPIVELTRGVPRNAKEWQDVFSLLAKHLKVSGDRVVIQPELGVPPGSIGNADLRDSQAVSVIGRASNSVGDPADIVASADGLYLGRRSNVVSFLQLKNTEVFTDRTVQEIAAGVTPVNYSYDPGDVRRYGAVGDGVANDTTALRSCLLSSSGAPYRMYIPKPSSKYKVDTLTIPSNITIECDRGVVIEARSGYGATDVLLDFTSASNVTMICNGATFQMLKAEYTTGEHRHCFNLENCTDVAIFDAIAKDSGGDGFYINGATRLLLHNPYADNNRRQGFSVIKATDLTGTGVWKAYNTTGTAPEYGVDFEPNGPTDSLIRINIECIDVKDNDGAGVGFYFDNYKTGSPADVSISISRITSLSNGAHGVWLKNIYLNSGSYGGFIKIGEVISEGDASNAVYVLDKSSSAPFLDIGRVVAINPCTGSSAFADTAAVYLADTSAAASGGIHIGSVIAKATHTDMDYAVILEMGAGFTDVRLSVENSVGYQVSPVRWNNITSTIAEASSAIVDTSKLTDTIALTTGTNIVATAHVGRVITNAGASGSVTLALREYLPQNNPYRFRVEAAQTIAIDTFDAADQIEGTTAAGQTVTSNVVGAGCDVYYVGTLGGVRLWRLQPLGNPASWTFN